MSYLERVLESPSYGFVKDGKFYKPSHAEIFHEFFAKLNVIKSRKNWLSAFTWFVNLSLSVPFLIFLFNFFTWKLFLIGMVYSMVALGTHGTVYLHRYGTHRAFQFKNKFWVFICRNLVIKNIPEETYIVSHHVHHQFSEQPGDPYNVNGGWLYCFLADVTHQGIRKNMTEAEYKRVAKMLDHTGVHSNSYAGYKKWGSICQPAYTIFHYTFNWIFWYGTLYLIGGHALATAIFGCSVIWAIGVRTYNYDGHGGGKDKRKVGSDFNRADLSVNQIWPGFVAGEWHNNHHLFPNGIRSGFLFYQLDTAWLVIKAFMFLGAVKSSRDYKDQFMAEYYYPYRIALFNSLHPKSQSST